jgi:hypothetical protein
MAGIWGESSNYVNEGVKTYGDLIAAQLNKAKAVEQEQKNPLVRRRELAEILSKEIENKYKPEDYKSTFASRYSNISHQKEEDVTSKYKRDHGLLDPTEIQILKSAYGGNIPGTTVASGGQGNMAQPQQPQQSQPPLNDAISQILQQIQGRGGMTRIPDQNQMSNNVAQSMNQQSEQQAPQQQKFIEGTQIPSTGRGGLADAMVLHALGISPETAANADYKKTIMKVAEANLKAGNFDKMPAAQKAYAIDQAMGFGLSNTEATKRFRNGETIEDIAKEKGFDANKPNEWPAPIAPPTNVILSRQQRANVANAGLNAIDPIITKAMEPYASRWNGKSLNMLVDAVKGKNVEQQSDAIAAGALAMEVAALRLNASGAPVGVKALEMMVDKAQNQLQVIGPTLSPEVYKKSQQKITKMINIINNAENKATWNYSQQGYDAEDKQQQQEGQSSQSDPLGIL